MDLNIIFLPLLSFLVCGLFGSRIGFKGTQMISIYLMVPIFLLSIIAFYKVGFCQGPFYINLGAWIQSDILQVDWSFLFDSLTVTILILVKIDKLLQFFLVCVGDFSLIVAVVIFYYFKSLDYGVVLVPFFIEKKISLFCYDFYLLDVICFLFFIGAVDKSAQLGLHTWLPDGMNLVIQKTKTNA